MNSAIATIKEVVANTADRKLAYVLEEVVSRADGHKKNVDNFAKALAVNPFAAFNNDGRQAADSAAYIAMMEDVAAWASVENANINRVNEMALRGLMNLSMNLHDTNDHVTDNMRKSLAKHLGSFVRDLQVFTTKED